MTLGLSNFLHLSPLHADLARLGLAAERYFATDANTSLLKLRQFAELMAQLIAARTGVYQPEVDSQSALLGRLKASGYLPNETAQLFHLLRKIGNEANHQFTGNHRVALDALKVAAQLGFWFQRTFANPEFKGGAFVPPSSPGDESKSLKLELATMREQLAEASAKLALESEKSFTASQLIEAAQEDAKLWEQLADETSASAAELKLQLDTLQAKAKQQTSAQNASLQKNAQQAATKIHLDEKASREIIDQQLRESGWEADSNLLRYSSGVRPEPGRYLAIAEWPTESGPADYALFIGIDCVAVVEAKRRNRDVSSAIDQAKRYARGIFGDDGQPFKVQWGEFRVPIVLSTNGRPFQRQFKEASGTWFCDLRRAQNLRKPLDGWYTPQGLRELLKQDLNSAEQKLDEIGFRFGFPLRDYQRRAIIAVENNIKLGKTNCLVAMATGTGKTKTCIALVYRLLKAQRFRRILFLVDRSALGEQAANAFKETQMESLQRFSDIFGIKEIDEQAPEADTKVHIATVQGLVRRILYSDDNALTVDSYDCIVVDECHRGYLLDREMSDTEVSFRDQSDYISKYRRVLDHFDAIKIGLTATPALHTSEIFGEPVFVYSYREAVLDGYLIDHDPPLHILTQLSTEGIHWKVGEAVPVYNPISETVDLFNAPDELDFEISEFNKKVITESFNRVVCTALTDYLSPYGPEKTLIFCATDRHADMVVRLLKDAFKEKGIEVDDDAITKITGSADQPLKLIRRYRNETNPAIAVTVDLLTTGIDVPSITNLVFLRRVNSRILFEQMLGRATRRCDDIGKEVFRIFDAVDIYDSLEAFNTMKPVVQNPNIGFAQLIREITEHAATPIAEQAKDQLLGKWQRKKRHLNDTQQATLEQAGMSPDDFGQWLKQRSVTELASWFTQHPGLGELLDQKREFPSNPVVISHHDDRLTGIDPHYGKAEDFLQKFSEFIQQQSNKLPALIAVLQRPRELTRKDLVQLITELEGAGFDERSLTSAWAKKTNQEIAARLLGFVRQAALGDALIPFDQRVDAAVQCLLQQHAFTPLQQDWLKRLAKQLKANVVLDEASINDGPFREQGGFKRLNQIFEGQLPELLAEINEAVWQSK